MTTRAEQISEWMRAQVEASGSCGIALGLSGGIDSAVVLGLAAMATPGRVLGVLMPCYSDPRDEEDALIAASHFDAPTIRVDLGPTFDQLVADLGRAAAHLTGGTLPSDGADADRKQLPLANVKPRLRMTTLYYVANTLGYLVAGTGNRSELTIGYFTKYGDGGVDMLPIGRLLKSEVRALARDLRVPEPIIEKPPSAGLWEGQTDEGEMGFTYAELESYLTAGASTVPASVAERIERLARTSDHKRALPPMPD
jgi:NAD+ synthase